ncbi:hypothetical protein O6H91_03G028300 [Diphasiastrum complanatum]|uniref:Uncharacterized protein n=2 Tax=Diphasiastrum complanatum TaxID=34168 RepID=A0ACC2E4P6_DIPCM|nr:hypothetical protein O6H91_03G028300 [Diphasiastrum complanatum]KAJ7561426.1 hypothetical protein O6H91_03G028300 [Diphasiastrum complanatum]
MDTRQQIGGTLPSQHSLQFASHAALSDDFLFFDTNCSLSSSVDLGNIDIDISSNISELTSLLECNATNASDSNFGPSSLLTFPQSLTQTGGFLPADEGSGTTNTVPGFPTSHQHHCLESSSRHQSLGQTLQPEQSTKQPDMHHLAGQADALHSAQEPSISPQYRDFEDANRQADYHSRRGIIQPESNFQKGSQQQPCPSQETTAVIARELSAQEQNPLSDSAERHRRNGGPSIEVKQELGQYTDQHSRLFPAQVSNYHLRQSNNLYIGNPGVEFSNVEVGSSKCSRVPQLSNISGSNSPRQVGVASESRSSNLINEAAVQSQAANQLSGLLTSNNTFQQMPALANLSNRQSLFQAQAANVPLSSFELQSPHQQRIANLVQGHGTAEVPDKAPLGTQQSLCHSSQRPSYQMLRSESFGGNRTANSFVSGAQQIFPELQPRLQSQLMQGLKVEGRHLLQHVPMGGTSVSGRPADGAVRHPVSPGLATKCEQLLMQYIQEQRRRPSDNSIQFWRDLVQTFFMQGAAKRWCLTSYNSSPVGRHAQGLFPMDYWFCNLCGVEPGRGFESSTDVLPRLFKIKYDSGLQDEVLFLDIAEERYMLSSGRIVLEYSKAVHESIFSELRIYSWEFCTKAHEEVVPRKNFFQQAHQLAILANKVDQDGLSNNAESLKSHCNAFTLTARNLAVKLDAPMVNDLGFSKRFVRCLQIAEVVNSMKDLISFEKKIGLGPIRSLASFPSGRKPKLDQGMSLKPVQHIANHFTHDYPASCSPSLLSSTFTHASGEKLNHISAQMVQSQGSNVLQGLDSFPHLSRSPNHLQSQVRSQMEARLSNLIHPQAYGLMQPPPPSQLRSVTPAQSQLVHQASSELVGQGMQALSQLSSDPSNTQGFNQQYCQMYNQRIQQPYQQHNKNQWVQQASSQVHSLSQSVNPIGQPSLPGTPQSEMSDMRSTT